MPKLPKPKLKAPKAKQWYVRKRDKTVVSIWKVGKRGVDYCTMPMLEVYTVSVESFQKNFRPATPEEVAPYKDSLA